VAEVQVISEAKTESFGHLRQEFRITDAPKGSLVRQLRGMKGRRDRQMTRACHVIQGTKKGTSPEKNKCVKLGSLTELANVTFMRYGDLKPLEACETRTDKSYIRS